MVSDGATLEVLPCSKHYIAHPVANLASLFFALWSKQTALGEFLQRDGKKSRSTRALVELALAACESRRSALMLGTICFHTEPNESEEVGCGVVLPSYTVDRILLESTP